MFGEAIVDMRVLILEQIYLNSYCLHNTRRAPPAFFRYFFVMSACQSF